MRRKLILPVLTCADSPYPACSVSIAAARREGLSGYNTKQELKIEMKICFSGRIQCVYRILVFPCSPYHRNGCTYVIVAPYWRRRKRKSFVRWFTLESVFPEVWSEERKGDENKNKNNGPTRSLDKQTKHTLCVSLMLARTTRFVLKYRIDWAWLCR